MYISTKIEYQHIDALTHSSQLFLHMCQHNVARAWQLHIPVHLRQTEVCVATISTKVSRKQRSEKSCNAKGRELTGMTELILTEINETV